MGMIGVVVRQLADVPLVRGLRPDGAQWMAVPRFLPVGAVAFDRVVVCGDWLEGLSEDGKLLALEWFDHVVRPRCAPGADTIEHVTRLGDLAGLDAQGRPA